MFILALKIEIHQHPDQKSKHSYMGEAPGEVLESGLFTEILGHYISVDYARLDVYILRCHAQVSRQTHLQHLINYHTLIDLVVGSMFLCHRWP
jgi:hypothetical protein